VATAKQLSDTAKVNRTTYRKTLRRLWVELVKLQRHVIEHDEKIVILFEGRDAAGKDGTIKRIIKHLSPREVRVVALGKPSDRETTSWYFQRFVPHLPAAQDIVLFNRSWYNRAGVEIVMGFCTPEQHEEFLEEVPRFEHMLVRSGIRLLKYYLDITKEEQKARLAARRRDPLTQWKISPIDERAVKLWDKYTGARDVMLARTHNRLTPWTIVRADDKRLARLNVIRDILGKVQYGRKDTTLLRCEPDALFGYEPSRRVTDRLAS
jgi:polyphosphate kinase 2